MRSPGLCRSRTPIRKSDAVPLRAGAGIRFLVAGRGSTSRSQALGGLSEIQAEVSDEKVMKRLLFPLVLLIGVAGTVFAQPLGIEVVLNLLDSRVSEASIRRFIDRNQYTFEISAEDLIELKKAGASDELIEFLQDREDQEVSTGDGGTQPQASPEDVAEYTEADVYSGLEFGIGGYPFCSYPGAYYPSYPSNYPYPRYNDPVVVVPGGTGVYSHWHRNQVAERSRSSRESGSSSAPGLSGRALRTAPSSGSPSRTSGPRVASPPRHSAPSPSRTSHGGTGSAGGTHGGSRGRR